MKEWKSRGLKFPLMAAHGSESQIIGEYRPDFWVLFPDGHEELWEIKAWDKKKNRPRMTAEARLKMKIFRVNYPKLQLCLKTGEDLPKGF